MRKSFFTTATTSAFIVFASSITAQEIDVAGKIIGTIGEESSEWSTLKIQGMGASANFDSPMSGFTAYSIQGHEGSTPELTRAVSITFTRLDNGSIIEPGVVYLPTGSMSEFMESAEGAVQIGFDEFVQGDDFTTITGTVTGTIRPVARLGMNYVDDPSGTVPVNLTFSTKVFPEN